MTTTHPGIHIENAKRALDNALNASAAGMTIRAAAAIGGRIMFALEVLDVDIDFEQHQTTVTVNRARRSDERKAQETASE